MKVLKMLQFEKDDTQDFTDLREVEEFCNMAAAFFYEDRLGREEQERGEGLRAIRVLTGGHPIEARHIQAAIDEVNAAMVRLRGTAPSQFLTGELKDAYLSNLTRVLSTLVRWRRAAE